MLALIGRIHSKANEYITQELEKRGIRGLVVSHGEILVNLYRYQRLSMKELAGKIDKRKNTLTVLVEKLIEFDYVEKTPSPEDGRFFYITLTEKGRLFQKDFEEISTNVYSLIYTGFSEADQEKLMELLEKMYKNL